MDDSGTTKDKTCVSYMDMFVCMCMCTYVWCDVSYGWCKKLEVNFWYIIHIFFQVIILWPCKRKKKMKWPFNIFFHFLERAQIMKNEREIRRSQFLEHKYLLTIIKLHLSSHVNLVLWKLIFYSLAVATYLLFLYCRKCYY